MNVTELARILKVNPQELREILPQLGFHVGQKAIKVDNRLAQKIIRDWPRLIKEYEKQKAEDSIAPEDQPDQAEKVKKIITIPQHVTVRDLANLTKIPVNKILAELMKNGVFISLNEKIDYETAAVVGSDLDLDIKLDESQEEDITFESEKNKLSQILSEEKKEKLQNRPPVIVVMGHVDHGKTKLLDAIRRTHVVDGEAGGITQHIGAYQATRRNRLITFIDTPGHEAFTAMRSRGTKVADIAILVVAADDGVKPQTIEAFRIIEAAKIPFVVAINKIDKPEADINKTKQELSTKLNITPEDWGGKTICVPISAKDGQGIEDLLDMILLVADMEADKIKANPDAKAAGTVIESNVDKGAGIVVTILIQNGVLRVGDQLCFRNMIYGKARALKNYKGEVIKEARPSVPVMILGLKISPQVGDILEVGEGEKCKINKMKTAKKFDLKSDLDENEEEEEKIKKINLIIKSDVLGSAEAVEESLEKISTEEVKTKIIYKGLGNIIEGDIERAETAKAQIVGFNVKIAPQVENLIREKGVKAKIFNIIYDLIAYVKEEMQALIEPEIKKIDLGQAKVLNIFRTDSQSQIIGAKILKGRIERDSMVEVIRDKNLITEGKIVRLQAGKQDVSRVEEGQECGLQFEGKPIVEKDDLLNFYKEEKMIKKI
ncbi:MAG: translation initiation factor IF-2 [Patescibacteria group bacterium]